jgi:hypothetical protein
MKLLRAELSADHFEARKRLSDANFWVNGPPREGFFRIWHGAPSTDEGPDLDGEHSYRSITHQLHFTSKFRGNNRSDYFQAYLDPSTVPPGSPLRQAFSLGGASLIGIDSRYEDGNSYPFAWAEVAYFLRPSLDASGNQDTANGTPLYCLYRRQMVAVPDNTFLISTVAVPAAGASPYLDISCNPDPSNTTNLYFNGPMDLTVPDRRFAMNSNLYPNTTIAGLGQSYPTLAEQYTTSNIRKAQDLLLSDVISFDVRMLFAGGSDFVDLFDSGVATYSGSNPNFVFTPAGSATGPLVFDTWSSLTDNSYDYSTWSTTGTAKTIPLFQNSSGQTLTIRAIKVTIRVWDFKTEQSRQATIIQDL